jgi:Protein of unknown function (DUF3108)
MSAPRRWLYLCMIGTVVMAWHALLLLLLGRAGFDSEGPPAAAAQTVLARTVETTAAVPRPLPSMPEATPMAPGTAAATVRRVPRHSPAAATASAVRSEPAAPATAVVAQEATPEVPAVPPASAIEVPVYATRLPPAGRWHYRLQRGLAVGAAELRWSPQADASYELQLEGRVAGDTLLDWVSQGQIDAAGIAPERFALRRRGRDRQAVNFQRRAGKITFSGPTHELPLLPGVQDRLSWMLQLPAIVAAAPERFAVGAAVLLYVAGARGDGDVWTFVVEGVETLGNTPALKFVREPRKLYDTRVEIWLDPGASYMPLRTVQTPTGGGAALELIREHEAR